MVALFGEARAEVALDLLELTELAWHDSYNEISPSESMVDDILLVSAGTLDGLVRAARLAVRDWRDINLWAQRLRSEEP